MLMISSRDKFWDSNTLSDSDEIRDVVLDDDSLGSVISKQNFLNSLHDKRVILLIHGYNNEGDDVVRSYDIIDRNISIHLKEIYDSVIGYTWPGGDDRFDYSAAKTRAGAVAPRVRRWLKDIADVAQAVDIMNHSMGGRVVLTSLRDARAPKVRNLFNMASAVDNESIQINEKFYDSSKNCEVLYVFHSKNDSVLKNAYQLAEWDRALGYSGPEDPELIMKHSPNVRIVNCKNIIRSHGGYKDSEAIYKFIAMELQGVRAPQYSTL